MNTTTRLSRLLRAAIPQIETRSHFHPSSLLTIPHKVEVLYCRAWGYGRRFDLLRMQLNDAFAPSLFGGKDIVTIEGKADEVKSGAFEVFVEGKLVHSKLNGDGYLDTDEKLDNLISVIEDLGVDWKEICGW